MIEAGHLCALVQQSLYHRGIIETYIMGGYEDIQQYIDIERVAD